MATVAEVKKKAATKLGFAIGKALDANWDVQMQDAYDETYEELREIDLVTWAQTGTVPDKVADYVADLMAFKRADIYATQEIRAEVTQRFVMAERNIRRALVGKYQSTEEQSNF